MDSKKLQEMVDDLGSRALDEEQKARQQEPEPEHIDNITSPKRKGHLKLLLSIALVCIAVLFWRMADLEQSLTNLYAKIAELQNPPEQKESAHQRDIVNKPAVLGEKGVTPGHVPQISDASYQYAPRQVERVENESELNEESEADYRDTEQSEDLARDNLQVEDNAHTPESNSFVRTVKVVANLDRVICLLDYVGKNGPVHTAMVELTPDLNRLGIKPKFSTYTDIVAAEKSFKDGDCDMLMLPDYLVRKYNSFTSTFSAVGAIPDYRHLKKALSSLSSTKAAKLMRKGDYEIVGILPLGASFFYINNRENERPQNFNNLRIAVSNYAPGLSYIANLLEMIPVSVTDRAAAGMFNAGNIDLTINTNIDYEYFNLYQGLGGTGGILQFPVKQLTMQLIVRHEDLPSENFSQNLRDMFFAQHRTILHKESDIPGNYKIYVDKSILDVWDELFRKTRISLREQAIYDPKALTLFRKVRCKVNPNRDECVSSDRE